MNEYEKDFLKELPEGEQVNVRDAFDEETGVFTAPYTGFYQFTNMTPDFQGRLIKRDKGVNENEH